MQCANKVGMELIHNSEKIFFLQNISIYVFKKNLYFDILDVHLFSRNDDVTVFFNLLNLAIF